jgi:hypothetical protein
MEKDAYYFPHFCNARNDRKLRRLRKDLSIEGYGIYFMILEVLREQKDFRYPIKDIDLLADEFRTSEEKIKVVISKYNLFEIDENEQFFSPKFIEYLDPYLQQKQRNRINGIKGNLIRYNHATKAELNGMSDAEIIDYSNTVATLSGGESGGESGRNRNKSKVNKSKVNKSNRESSDKSELIQSDNSGQKENQKSLKEITEKLVAEWNAAANTSLRYTNNKKIQVRARLKTYSKEELVKAIRHRAADDWIKNNNQLPNWDALFRNDDQIDQWLNRPPENKTKVPGSVANGVSAEGLTRRQAKQYSEEKRIDFTPSMFTIKKNAGEEDRYVPNF